MCGKFSSPPTPVKPTIRAVHSKFYLIFVLGSVLASGHPHDDHGIVKQGVFKVYPLPTFLNSIYFNSSSSFSDRLSQGSILRVRVMYAFHWHLSLCGAKKRWRLGRRQDCCQEPLDQETWPRNSWLWTFHEKSFNPHGESQRVDILTENPIFMSYWKHPNNISKENPRCYFYEKLL